MEKHFSLIKSFRLPLLVLAGIIAYLFLQFFHQTILSLLVVYATILLGSYKLVLDTFNSLIKKQFALDYIAILAVVVSIITKEYLVGAVIALMLTSGQTLEEYGASAARASLTKLIDRIPRDVWIFENGRAEKRAKIEEVAVGEHILIRKGEVIALDGILVSKTCLTDESSLTGEAFPVEKSEGDQVRSGTVNIGEQIVVKVTKASKDSTYKKIIALVEEAQEEKAPLVRLADQYSTVFTLITALIASFAYFHFRSLESILAVLVVATPCPLIIATPIALLGGVNAAARKRIIIKKLASLEVLARVNAIVLDKTGTITLGKPKVTKFETLSRTHSPSQLLAISEAIERSSLHPLAKAIVSFAREKNAPVLHATDITETIGKGIQGKVEKKNYALSRVKDAEGMTIALCEGQKRLALFHFADEIKEDSKHIVKKLRNLGISLSLFTGDKQKIAQEVARAIGGDILVKAEALPEDKRNGIEELKKQGKITAMVGDGINDAPALALADVGMVFSSEEQTAATDAADVVFLGGTFSMILQSLQVSQKTISIAMQSILWGIGLSIGAMILAGFGLIPPLVGAGIQEAIDVAVIVNALRASR